MLLTTAIEVGITINGTLCVGGGPMKLVAT